MLFGDGAGAVVLSPSEDLALVAQRYAYRMPRLLRLVLDGLGTPDAQSADLMSYLLFDAAYTRTLVEIGYGDAGARIDEIEAFLADAGAAWPDSVRANDERQLKRLGFQLDKAGRPTIRSQVRDVVIEDAIRPDSSGASLRRELRMRAPANAETNGLFVLLAQGKSIAKQSDGSYAVNDRSYFVIPAGAAQPVVRDQGGRSELLVPVRFDRGEATVAYSIVW